MVRCVEEAIQRNYQNTLGKKRSKLSAGILIFLSLEDKDEQVAFMSMTELKCAVSSFRALCASPLGRDQG